jgi:hypothetical protein
MFSAADRGIKHLRGVEVSSSAASNKTFVAFECLESNVTARSAGS